MSTQRRPIGLGAVLLGSAAATVFFGAGTALADDAVSPAGVSSTASSSDVSGVSSGPAVAARGGDTPRRGVAAGDDRDGETRKAPSRKLTAASTALVERSARSARLALTSEVADPAPARPERPSTPVPAPLASVSRQESGRAVDDTVRRLPAVAHDGGVDAALVPLVRAIDDPGQAATQFTRQIVGLTSDVGAVGASLVNNVAVQIAQGFGPSPVVAIPRLVALTIADAAADVSRAFTGTPLNAASAGPFPVNYGVFDVLAYLTPAAVPPGANDPSISVTAQRPLPVILVNGTGMTAAFNWSVGAPVLANAGYKVYTFNYGNRSSYPNFPVQGVNDITVSAQQLSQEVDRVLAETGAPKVILVGYSQGGGILPAYYINVLGGGPKVSQVIGLAPSNHGTDLDYLAYATLLPVIGPLLSFVVGTVAPGALQQTITSPFQEVVYGRGDTRPGVLYTNIVSINDEVVTPYTQQFLSGPNVTNILVQSRQPSFIGGHGSVLVSPTVWSLVLEALAANPAANPQGAPSATATSVAA
ncbi:lipase [Mycolicibacterium sp. S2-37]|uniref:alpha/beta fold hydrolase n=1 Tax=Mycolicibacterium sp. S2-37 TaxID=2810297 RepID=UPI001A93F10E|nr:alpha/beta fold hydrolase [Mycolicibacterium sp. S2-37]MBO0676927.1 lipase [Mycolicibacterium sp. S2-37]